MNSTENFSDHKNLKLEINHRKKNKKRTYGD